ncbi:MAG: hypothetical protein RLZZ26_199 [Candidatus Parcubacteria bacterium]|jgi:cellulose synthase/poly-beta-1,6-N-acetylglucosamine synthase-like glycosyltransferase
MQKQTLTIGIAAHNEERNIGSLLQSLLAQEIGDYALDSITVLCDGCTDTTPSVVRSFSEKDSRVTLVNDGQRMGKIERLNWLYQHISSDYLLILDADVRLNDSHLLTKVLAGFTQQDVGLVAGLQLPESSHTFIQSVFVTWETIWVETRMKINNGVSVHNLAGCVFAMKKGFYQSLAIPKDIIADDEFLFFEAKRQKVGFVFLPEAIVYYRVPDTLREYCIQSARYMTTKDKIIKHFELGTTEAYSVPLHYKLRALAVVWLRAPILTTLAVSLQIPLRLYIHLFPVVYRRNTWEVATSTK